MKLYSKISYGNGQQSGDIFRIVEFDLISSLKE